MRYWYPVGEIRRTPEAAGLNRLHAIHEPDDCEPLPGENPICCLSMYSSIPLPTAHAGKEVPSYPRHAGEYDIS